MTAYAKPESIEDRERQLGALLAPTLSTRYLEAKRAKHLDRVEGDKVLTTFALLQPDGSPRYVGIVRRQLATREALYVRLVVGQGVGEKPLSRKFNLAHAPTVRAAYNEAVGALCHHLGLDQRQRQTLLAAWPAFVVRHAAQFDGFTLDAPGEI